MNAALRTARWTKREIAEMLRAVPFLTGPAPECVCPLEPDYSAMAHAVVERVVEPLEATIGNVGEARLQLERRLKDELADRDARLARLVEALNESAERFDKIASVMDTDGQSPRAITVRSFASDIRAALADAAAKRIGDARG